MLGYSNGTTVELLTHLWNIYRITNEDMMVLYLIKINAPWAPPTLFKSIITQFIKKQNICRKKEDLITETSAIHSALNIIEQNRIFKLSCRE